MGNDVKVRVITITGNLIDDISQVEKRVESGRTPSGGGGGRCGGGGGALVLDVGVAGKVEREEEREGGRVGRRGRGGEGECWG